MSPRPSVEAERREEVLRATWALLTERGLAQVRVADIAARVGVSTGPVHYYFRTKNELLEATFRFVVAQARLASEAALAGKDDPWGRLVAVLDAHMPEGSAHAEWVLWLQLWNEALVTPALRALDRESYDGWLALVEGIVRDGQERGAFRPVPPHDFVLRLLTMMDGLVIQHTMDSAEITLPRLRELLLGFARDQLIGDGTP